MYKPRAELYALVYQNAVDSWLVAASFPYLPQRVTVPLRVLLGGGEAAMLYPPLSRQREMSIRDRLEPIHKRRRIGNELKKLFTLARDVVLIIDKLHKISNLIKRINKRTSHKQYSITSTNATSFPLIIASYR